MTTPAKSVDWERIEADYRAGVLSVREIAASQGITHGAINKRAKRDEWTRDLAARIQAKADALVSKRQVSKEVSALDTATDKKIVEANAEVIAGVRLAHRTDIARARSLAMTLLEEVEWQSVSGGSLAKLDEAGRGDDDKSKEKRAELIQRVLSGPSRISSMRSVAETLRTLISLEREAYGIADVNKPGGGGGQVDHNIEVTFVGSNGSAG